MSSSIPSHEQQQRREVAVEPARRTSEARNGSVADRLAQVRRHTLDMLLFVTLCSCVLNLALYGPPSWSAGNTPFLVVTCLQVLGYGFFLVLRPLPLRLRAWGFCLVGLGVFAAYLPRGVFAVPLVTAVVSAIYVALLLGPRAGVAFTLLVLAMLAGAALLPPQVVAALAYGPPHPPGSDPPLIVASGLIPLLAAPVGVTIVLRGLLRGFEESQAGEQRLRGVIEASPEAMAMLDWPGGRHCEANAAYEKLFGWSAAELMGHTLVEMGLLREADLQLLQRRLDAEPRVSGIEILMRRRAGATAFVEAGLHRTEIGRRPVVLVVLREVTTQRSLEAAVRHAQRVEAMGTLVGGIAHNFRNALGSILPNLDYSLEKAGPEVQEALQDARSAASAAVDLAARLTRMTHQEATVHREPVELRAVLADVIGICRSTFGARTAIRETLDVPGLVLADRGELHQVFLNLLINARDATADVRSPRIDVTLVRAGGSRLVTTVADNGHGMDDDTLRRVGEPFFTTKSEGKGTGLGLSSAFAAVRDAGGRVTVTSRPGEGTTFAVDLPVHSGEALEPERPAPGPLTPGVRVLVVDDDPLLLEAVRRQLTSLGLEAEPFTDPLAALERLRAAPRSFDLLLTDLDMPVLSGRELASHAHQLAPSLPVLVLSGTENPSDVPGAMAVLAKPATTAALALALARCLGLDAAHAA